MPPTVKKARRAITNEQRLSFRKWYKEVPNRVQQEGRVHWNEQYGYMPGAGTICDILSKKYEFLDKPIKKTLLETKKRRAAHWETLEAALFEWHMSFENAGFTSTGDLLRFHATKIWKTLPEYNGTKCPEWTNGWIAGFKTRHGIKERTQHGEAGSAVVGEEAHQTMEEIRREAANYTADTVYNMDETGYFWKAMPTRGLSTERMSGQKQDKQRITAVLCCNASGTDKMPLWFVGKSGIPNCFRAEKLKTLEPLGAYWRNNGAAWIDNVIVIEWLRWFDKRVGRPCLLLMDNFAAHVLAVKILENEGGLQHTKVMWLPPNATSVFQPLDQGVINNWKVFIKKQLFRYISDTFDAGEDPYAGMHVLRSIRWGISAWEFDVKPSTIRNCWGRSQAIDFVMHPALERSSNAWTDSVLEITELESQIDMLQTQQRLSQDIRSIMDIRNLVNPGNEEIVDVVDDHLIDTIIARHMPQQEENEEETEIKEVRTIPIDEAIAALSLLQLYEEQQELSNGALLQHLWNKARVLNSRMMRAKAANQSTLSSWLSQSSTV